MNKVPITEAEKNSPYYKYYMMDMTPVSPELLANIKDCHVLPEQTLPLEQINRLLDPEFHFEKLGYVRMEDGTVRVTCRIPMPKVTTEMFEWWFAWHGLDPMRYKMWDPEDHYHCLTRHPEISRDASLPMKKRYRNTIHDVVEDVSGFDMLGLPTPGKIIDLAICFTDPEFIGFDSKKLEDFDGTIVCSANDVGIAIMCHVFRMTENGGELLTHYWVGYRVVDGKPEVLPPPVLESYTDLDAQGLFAHNIKEYSHLAELLPQVYEEFKDCW